ncbi:MAG: DUF2281 domain-containing protein [Bacteroidia bacterium]|nr:DUF2281 domain-containing protein [Bacteroidia bacterium]
MHALDQLYIHLERMPEHLQAEVLHYAEFLMQRYRDSAPNEPAVPAPRRRFSFMGAGDSQGAINAIPNLRDYAYES